MDEHKIKNPWMGLRTYAEGDVIHGRNKEIEDLSLKIIYNVQTVIYGRSGIGKSSLLNAGVFPILRRRNLFPVPVRLMHGDSGVSYCRQIIASVEHALEHLKVEDLGAEQDKQFREVKGYAREVVSVSDRNHEMGLWEYFHSNEFYYRLDDASEEVQVYPVLVIDQFEEIFTLQRKRSEVEGFFGELASLLNNVCPEYLLNRTVNIDSEGGAVRGTGSSLFKIGVSRTSNRQRYIKDSQFHVILSLREDFLSHLERNIQHIPLLRQNRYCLLPLNEEQAAKVIMSPISGLVSLDVAKEIICKVTGLGTGEFDLDGRPEIEVDSAMLSLFLRELYEKKQEGAVITHELVESFGKNIIPDFYGRTISAVSRDTAEYLERRLVTSGGRRDSVFMDEVQQHVTDAHELDYLLQQRILHEYPWRDGMRLEFSHDVLCPVIMARRLARDEEQKRLEQEAALLKSQREKKRLVYVLLAVVISFLATGVVVYDGWFDVKTERYSRIVKNGTWIEGLDKISQDRASHLFVHYVFYRKGRWSDHPYLIEARNGYGRLTSFEHKLCSNLVELLSDDDKERNNELLAQLATVVRLELHANTEGDFCLQEKAFSKDGTLIYSFNNTPYKNDGTVVSTFTDNKGFPILMSDSSYVITRSTFDENGREVLKEYFDKDGYPRPNSFDAYAVERSYFGNGVMKGQIGRFVNGQRLSADSYCGWKYLQSTEDGLVNYEVNYDRDGKIIQDGTNSSVQTFTYDSYGRQLETCYWCVPTSVSTVEELEHLLAEGRLELIPVNNNYGYHRVGYEYNEYGEYTCIAYYDAEGNPCLDTENGHHQLVRDYDQHGNLIKECHYDTDGRQTAYYECRFDENDEEVFGNSGFLDEHGDSIKSYYLYWTKDGDKKIIYDYYWNDDLCIYTEHDRKGNMLERSLYKRDGKTPDQDEYGCHKELYSYRETGNRTTFITKRVLGVDGKPHLDLNTSGTWKFVIKVDSVNYTKSQVEFTLDDEQKDIFRFGIKKHYEDSTFSTEIGESSLDYNGTVRRNYDNDLYYYHRGYIRSLLPNHKEIKGFYVLNEFGDPGLIWDNGNRYSVFYKGKYYDEYGIELQDGNKDYPEITAMYVRRPNSTFESGDILLAQDDWKLWYDNIESIEGLDLAPSSEVEHKCKVLRFNESKKEYEIHDVVIPVGMKVNEDFRYMMHFCTQTEIERIIDILKKELSISAVR